MEKSEEIKILRDAAKKLGPDSYIGPWLAEVTLEVEGLPRQDLIPKTFAPTIRDTRRECDNRIHEAATKAMETIEAAKRRAEQITAAAEKAAQGYRDRLLRDLEQAVREVRHW